MLVQPQVSTKDLTHTHTHTQMLVQPQVSAKTLHRLDWTAGSSQKQADQMLTVKWGDQVSN